MSGFLWGPALIAADGTPAVQLEGADDGDDQIARGYRERGSMAGWRDAIAPVLDRPKVRLAVAASLAAPLLAVLDAPNFAVELCGETSRGKTVTLRLAASCWGSPDERAPGAALGTWDITRVGAERTLAVLRNLPLILEDTRRAKDPEQVVSVVYDVANGRGCGRGTLKGVQGVSTWSTILLSSGESSVNDLTEKGGRRPG